MRARDVMRTPVVTISDKATIREAVELLCSTRVGGVLVLNDNRELVGILSDYDIIRAMMPTYEDVITAEAGVLSPDLMEDRAYQVRDTPVKDIMSKNPITLQEDDPIVRAASAVITKRVRWLPVVKDKKPIGVVSRIDILQALMQGGAS